MTSFIWHFSELGRQKLKWNAYNYYKLKIMNILQLQHDKITQIIELKTMENKSYVDVTRVPS